MHPTLIVKSLFSKPKCCFFFCYYVSVHCVIHVGVQRGFPDIYCCELHFIAIGVVIEDLGLTCDCFWF